MLQITERYVDKSAYKPIIEFRDRIIEKIVERIIEKPVIQVVEYGQPLRIQVIIIMHNLVLKMTQVYPFYRNMCNVSVS
jgi:hypothetical protein